MIDTKFSSILAVDDSFIKQSLKVYPNPAKDNLTVSNNGIDITSIEIYNLLGQKLNSYNPNREILDISGLKSAVYYLKIKDENGNKATYKIIKS
ncbi:T9SS type A sorting domain-containing protein [Aureibaculum sp. A20]|uniref:T9SS type A sorting domain-containing protein n=1 Tax=Aureibaculum flavum TaxID=2795986 RepID=A0ABS0WW31_9FLAO|nr:MULTISPECIES: T9SS type A sorting domain-containing protein [Aureibaculum]MBJ2176106.1 T9SS type A sorting domain-containing protein [Aureibaculum flavum]